MNAPQPIEIFRAGRQTAASGQTIDFTEEHLQAVVDAYDPALHEAPLCVGHPKTDLPAYGWVKGLQLRGDVLYADPDQVDPAFAELVRAGRFKKRSAAFYPPDAPGNPKPGSYYLRHVAFLGAQPPAVKGLRDVQFAASEDAAAVLEFGDWADQQNASLWRRMRDWLISTAGLDKAEAVLPSWQIEAIERDALAADTADSELPADAAASTSITYADRGASQVTPEQLAAQAAQLAAERSALDAREAALVSRESAAAHATRMAEFGEFATGLVNEGRLLPKDQQALVNVLGALPDAVVLEFGEGDEAVKKPAVEVLRDFLKGLPKQVHFGEHAGVAGAGGADVDIEDGTAIARAAVEFQEAEAKAGRAVSIEAAVQHIVTTNKGA